MDKQLDNELPLVGGGQGRTPADNLEKVDGLCEIIVSIIDFVSREKWMVATILILVGLMATVCTAACIVK